jgi:hypothetical protein
MLQDIRGECEDDDEFFGYDSNDFTQEMSKFNASKASANKNYTTINSKPDSNSPTLKKYVNITTGNSPLPKFQAKKDVKHSNDSIKNPDFVST